MKWIKINESKDSIQMQFNEAFNEFRDSMIDDGLYLESDNKMLQKFKGILAKVCPSPDKIKDFFLNYGKKIDAKIQNSKFEELKKCWNSLKEMALSQDNEEISPEEAGIEPQGNDGSDQENSGEENQEVQDGENEQGVASESLYDEGIWDSVKKGWNSLATPDKPNTKGKKAPIKKGGKVAKKGVTQKKTSAKTTKTKKGASKGTKKSSKQMTAKEKILKFLREHWKQITFVLIAAIAVGVLGAWMAGAFATSSAVTGATATLTNFSLPAGMKVLPKGAKLIANGVVKYANGSIIAAPDILDDVDF